MSAWMCLDSKAEHRFRESARSQRCTVAWLNVSWTPHLLKLQWWPYSKNTNLSDSFDINKKGSCVQSISASLKCVNSTVCNLRVKILLPVIDSGHECSHTLHIVSSIVKVRITSLDFARWGNWLVQQRHSFQFSSQIVMRPPSEGQTWLQLALLCL